MKWSTGVSSTSPNTDEGVERMIMLMERRELRDDIFANVSIRARE